MMGGEMCNYQASDILHKFNTRSKVWSQSPTKIPTQAWNMACTKLYLKDGTYGIMIAGGESHNFGLRDQVFFLNLANEDANWVQYSNLPRKWKQGRLSYLGK